MTHIEIKEKRLSNHALTQTPFQTPEDVVSWFGAVQSQDYPGACWALSQRLNFLSNERIETAFNQGKILRTHVMRPTWHFVTAEDIRWMLELTGNRVKRMMGTYNKALGLDDKVFEKSNGIIEKELQDNNYLTRNELGDLLKKHGISWQGNGLAHIVMYAELDAIICSGPKKGKQHTYGLVSERAPQAKSMQRDHALKELARRYFQSHGPAQLTDFVWWSGLLTTDAKKGIELHKSMKYEIVDGKTYYFFNAPFHNLTKKIYLLPNYDEYTVAYRDRELLTEHVDKTKLDFRQNSLFNNVIVIDGKIQGVWRRTIKPKRVEVEARLFRNLNSIEQTQLSSSLEEYAHFLQLDLGQVKLV